MSTILESLTAAVEHHQAGELRRAEKVYRQVLRIDPAHPDALHLLGVIAHQTGKHELAAKKIRRAIRSNPRVAAFHNNLGSAYNALGRFDEAVACYRRALRLMPDYAEPHNNLGNTLVAQGKYDEAAASFQRATQIRPDYPEAHNNLSGALKNLGRFEESLASAQWALQLRPDYAEAYNNLGNALRHLDRSAEAEAAYQRALQIEPRYADVYGNLASLYERLSRLDEAKATAAQGLQVSPDHSLINLALAKCEEREGRHQEAIDRLVRVRPRARPGSDAAKEIVYQLGRLHDRIGDAGQAFDYFTEANRLASRLAKGSVGLKNEYCKTLDAVAHVFSESWVRSWSPAPPLESEDTPVFLIGFPRSGTTLLNVVLDGHPRIQALDEKPMVLEVAREIDAIPGGFAQTVPSLSPEQFQQLRSTYFRTADQFVERRPGHVLVDKNPLGTVKIGFILRLFPQAKFVVAVRHPCDACLSCFMQDFQINGATAGFFTLEDTAMLYAKVMSLWQQYLRVLPHPYHVVRYEGLVDDFEGETRRLLEFLNVDWDDAVLDYATHARARGRISTPSYRQVTESIYKRARYRWLRYAEQLAPIMGVLNPYIEYLGYEGHDPSC